MTTDPLQRYARSPRGTRIGDHTPCGHRQTYTVVAALRPTELTTTAVVDGPMDNATFRACVEQVLVPALWLGDVVVLNSFAVHKQPEVRNAIRHGGARYRFLPPYSPDCSPIELAFAKLKAFLRAARPRTFEQVCDRMAVALGLFKPLVHLAATASLRSLVCLAINGGRSNSSIKNSGMNSASITSKDARCPAGSGTRPSLSWPIPSYRSNGDDVPRATSLPRVRAILQEVLTADLFI